MEKDLRDAYAALKLLRADLVKTRRDKRALEAELSHFRLHEPLPGLKPTLESQETKRMLHEDLRAHLWRQATQYEAQVKGLERQLKSNYCLINKDTPEVEDNQQESDEVEKLELLNKLHSLTATVEQQMETMLAQKATFALQKDEIETTLEATQLQLQKEKSKVGDARLEQQAAKENYDFLETQVLILKQEKETMEKEVANLRAKLTAHAQTSSILKQQLAEKDEEQRKWKSEQEEQEVRLHLEHTEKTDALVKELSVNFHKQEKKCREEHQQEMTELQQRCESLELALSGEKEDKCQVEKELLEKGAMLKEYDLKCKELMASAAALTIDKSEAEVAQTQQKLSYETMLRKLQNELLDTQKHLTDSKNNEADVQSKLEAADAKLVATIKKYEDRLTEASQRLLDHEQDHQRYATSLSDVENELRKVQTKLVGSEATLLSKTKEFEGKLLETVQLSAQHEKTARILANENENFQHELYEARQAVKLTTEELIQCQLIIKQKTQEHLMSQQQCESLESQLLSANDHRDPSCASSQGNGLYVLEAFDGLCDSDIAALPSVKSWSLFRSGVVEFEDFLLQFQALVGAVTEVLLLCKTHAESLSVLCDQLKDKASSDSVLSVLLRLLRFTVNVKAYSQRDEDFVNADVIQSLRKRVVDALAQWFECDTGNSHHSNRVSMPAPTFTITSRETALILQNWTSDRSKQLGVRRWLARMEAYPGVPPLRGALSNCKLEIPLEGCTLELDEMTLEVKDAFLLLLIPILKQNQALHVRVFTRYIAGCETLAKKPVINDRGTTDEAKKEWAMRIHVQRAITQWTSRPTALKVSSSGPPSPLILNSPASSVSSSTSSSASSRLQIIQERLQYLHNNT